MSEDRGWPKGNFTTTDLLEGIDSRKYKFTFTSKESSDKEVLDMIRSGRIILKGCWRTVDKGQFRKIRPGLVIERSPIEVRDPRIRKTRNNE